VSVRRDTESEPSAESFAERWSRRKQAADEEEADQTAQASLPEAGEAPVPPLTDEDMPPLESLDERSDYAAFLSPGVSEQLRAQALRKLFKLPGMHLPDGLDDYDDDFTRFAELGKTITHEMQRMLDRELRAAETADGEDSQVAAADTGAPEVPSETTADENEQTTKTAGQEDDENNNNERQA
jgi:hypothetical protein